MSTLNTQQNLFAINSMGGDKTPTATVQGLGGSENVGLRPLFAFSFFAPLIYQPSDPMKRSKTRKHTQNRSPMPSPLRIKREPAILHQQKKTKCKKGTRNKQKSEKNTRSHTQIKKGKYHPPYLFKFPIKHVAYTASCKTHTLRRMALASTDVTGIDERDFGPLLDQVRAMHSAMVTEVTFRAPEDDTENSARLYITLDHCLTEGKLEELVA